MVLVFKVLQHVKKNMHITYSNMHMHRETHYKWETRMDDYMYHKTRRHMNRQLNNIRANTQIVFR